MSNNSKVLNLFRELVELIAPDVKINVVEGDSSIIIELYSEKNAGAIIGRKGVMIHALRAVFSWLLRQKEGKRIVRIDYIDDMKEE